MKKSFIGLAIIAIVAGFASCNKSSVSFSESDLHGKWQEEDKNAYVKFTVELPSVTSKIENTTGDTNGTKVMVCMKKTF